MTHCDHSEIGEESAVRTLFYATLFTLASCAGISSQPDLDDRLTSWTGSSVDELVSALGVPSAISEEWYEWRFTRPGMPAARSTNSVLSSRFGTCDPSSTNSVGCSSGSGYGSSNHTGGVDTAVPRSECIYRANVDGMTILEVVPTTISGNCRFDEIPFYMAMKYSY